MEELKKEIEQLKKEVRWLKHTTSRNEEIIIKIYKHMLSISKDAALDGDVLYLMRMILETREDAGLKPLSLDDMEKLMN